MAETSAEAPLGERIKALDPIKLICAIFIPPAAVWLEQQEFGTDLIINIVLTWFLWIPGVLHAFYILLGMNKK